MEISDRVWGNFKVNEPVLTELLESWPVQRLKGIAQYGIPKEMFSFPGFSRYEHSVGVMLLLRKLGAGVDEQAAGLTHDVSHTVFSHVVDFAFGTSSLDNYQDNRHKKVIESSELPAILQRHKMPVESIISVHNYSLLELEAPAVCADRLDYAMREFSHSSAPDIVNIVRDNLAVHEGEIIFTNFEAASRFGRGYTGLHTNHWAGNEAVIKYHILGNVIKKALKDGIIGLSDFDKTDAEVMAKLRASEDPLIQENLQKLSRHNVDDELAVPNSLGAIWRVKKFRYVDPKFFYSSNGKTARLSEVDPEYAESIEQVRKWTKKGIWIKDGFVVQE